MSEENVEIVRRFTVCWERSDWDGMAELADPNVEMHSTVGGVEEGRIRRGVAEIREDYQAAEDTWEEHRIEVEQLIDAGERVVIFQHEYMRGKSSGIELDADLAVLVDLRDGRIVRVQGYMDRSAALEAAGVPG
jgi:ketosteroid isomerase-like protein